MGLTRNQLSTYLNNIYQSSLFVDFCPNGLQIEGGNEIATIGTAVSASLATIEQAVKANVQALIVHHGLFWNRDGYTITGSKKEKIQLLLKNNISLFTYHLPMDAHREIGNNWKAAHGLGLQELEPFSNHNGQFIGVKGKLPSISRIEWQERLEDYYGHHANTAFGGKEHISSAAIISGGAYKQLQEAASEGLDSFITGNFDEPAWSQAFEEKINFYALGHAATERIGPKALAEFLKNHLKIDSFFLEDNNPF